MIKRGSRSRQDAFKEGETGIHLPAVSHHRESVAETTRVGMECGRWARAGCPQSVMLSFFKKRDLRQKWQNVNVCWILMQVKECSFWIFELFHYLSDVFRERPLVLQGWWPLHPYSSASTRNPVCIPASRVLLSVTLWHLLFPTCWLWELLASITAPICMMPSLHSATQTSALPFAPTGAPLVDLPRPPAGLPFRRRLRMSKLAARVLTKKWRPCAQPFKM